MVKPCKKKSYKDQRETNLAVRRLMIIRTKNPNKDGPGFFQSYKCPTCHQWHVGRWGKREEMGDYITRVIARDEERKKMNHEKDLLGRS